MRRLLVYLAGLAMLAAMLTEPAAAVRRSTVTNVSDMAVRICLTAVNCSSSGKLLRPGQNSRQVLGTQKLRALHVPKGWRAEVTTKGKRVTHSGPVTVRLPVCQCRRTVRMIRAQSTKLGSSRSGLPWLSGVWSGGRFTPSAIAAYGNWRGRPIDIVTAYSRRDSYRAMASEAWSINVWKGMPGRLNYGLALLPDSGEGSLKSIARGDQDWVWRSVAQNLKSAGRGNSIVRIGWEANLPDWRWGVTAAGAADYRRAFRRVAQVLRAVAPGLVIDFGIGCGPGLRGSSNRTAALTALYPGDDVVDVIHCDVFDWWQTKVKGSNPAPLTKPRHGVGLADVAAFSRKHGKLMGVGEWGLAAPHNGNGGGDNPAFIKAMHGFIRQNLDVFAYECYFDEPASYLKSSLTAGSQNPVAARTYRSLW
jgi:hypothetical protein